MSYYELYRKYSIQYHYIFKEFPYFIVSWIGMLFRGLISSFQLYALSSGRIRTFQFYGNGVCLMFVISIRDFIVFCNLTWD